MRTELLNDIISPSLMGDVAVLCDLDTLADCFDRIPIGIAIFNGDLTLYRCNHTWANFISLYGATPAHLVIPGSSLLDLVPSTDTTLKRLFERVLTGDTVHQPAIRIESNGSISYWNLNLASFDETETVKVLGVVGDVTKRIAAQENSREKWQDSQLYYQTLSLAAVQERERLARELHDNIAQALGYLNLQISITNQLLTEGQIDQARANLQKLKQLTAETYTDVREEIFSLRAKISSGAEFLDILRNYLTKYHTYYGLDVELILDGTSPPNFTAHTSSQVLRIIQEALINVRKHAKANEARIRFTRDRDFVCISIEDGGQGFDKEQTARRSSSNFGLQIMQERVQSVGGRLKIVSAPGEGSRLIIWVPVEPGS